MIKDYVIVTIVYLNAFYREKGQMIGYTYYTVTTVIVKTLFRLYKQSPWLHCLPQNQHCIKSHFMEWRSFDGYDHQLEHWCLCLKQSITKSIFDLLHITKGAPNSCSRHRKHHGNGEQNLNVGEGHTLCLTSQEQCCKFLQWQTLLLKDDQFESFPLMSCLCLIDIC